jgi:hypothetical protein
VPRKKRVFYPPPKTSARPAPTLGPDARSVNDRSVSIDLSALAGRGQLKPGDRVRISTGLYAGETATVESVSGGVIPAVLVRTEAGMTRRARTIDLEIARPGSEPRAQAEASAAPPPEPAAGPGSEPVPEPETVPEVTAVAEPEPAEPTQQA